MRKTLLEIKLVALFVLNKIIRFRRICYRVRGERNWKTFRIKEWFLDERAPLKYSKMFRKKKKVFSKCSRFYVNNENGRS